MSVEKTFNALVGDLEYPMFIVTARAGDEPLGCLVGFATQTSIDPPRFLVCLSQATTPTAAAATRAARRALRPRDAGGLAELFGGETGDEVDKFARTGWHEGPEGVPLLDDCANRFVGRVLGALDAGDHDAFLLEPVAAEPARGPSEFTFHRAKRITPGHAAVSERFRGCCPTARRRAHRRDLAAARARAAARRPPVPVRST